MAATNAKLVVAASADALLRLPAAVLAQELLAYQMTASNTKLQIEMGVTTSIVNVAGKDWQVTKENLDDFLQEMEANIQAYANAVEQRGYPRIAGRYAQKAKGECNGGDWDISRIFETYGADGQRIVLKEITLRQNGFNAEVLMPDPNSTDPSQQVAVPGVVVEDAFIVGNLGYEPFNLWGTIKGREIEVRFDEQQLKAAYGTDAGSDADWQTVRKCFVLLAPINS